MAKWIWYPGDYEVHHNLLLHTRRQEYSVTCYPPIWHLDDCYRNVRFYKNVTLLKPETVTVHAKGMGYIKLDPIGSATVRNDIMSDTAGQVVETMHPVNAPFMAPAGKYALSVHLMALSGLPSIFIDSPSVQTDDSWTIDNYDMTAVPVGCTPAYEHMDSDPGVFPFAYEPIAYKEHKQTAGGVLYDFGKQTFAQVTLTIPQGERAHLSYGESEIEALDLHNTVIREDLTGTGAPLTRPARAFRYLFIKGMHSGLVAKYEYLPLPYRASFHCSDKRLGEIWDVSAYTFHLNSREFFLDGIMRDRWVWSGDAYQSYFINDYLFFDPEITKRTILALRGKDPVIEHLNTIIDYSLYWIISIERFYDTVGDLDFVGDVFPRMKTLMDFCMARIDGNAFLVAKQKDWLFIDWADIDKTGAVCALQMLYAKALASMARVCALLGRNGSHYDAASKDTLDKIDRFFWDDEKGAYIDSFESGKRSVTRHANIFALLFDYASAEKARRIIQNVIKNDAVPPVTTPYFKFYELEALCRIGDIDYVMEEMRAYWGDMLDLGATSFWEEYKPHLSGNDHFAMYGDPYRKSLCHAWSASPIYIIGRYLMGVCPTSPGYATFTIQPHLPFSRNYEGTAPLGISDRVTVRLADGKLTVTASKDGGTLKAAGQSLPLPAGQPVTVDL